MGFHLVSSGTYSMKKRLFVPRWWLSGVFCLSQKRSSLCEAFLRTRHGAVIAGSESIEPKVFSALARFWHSVCSQVMAGDEFSSCRTVTVPAHELFRGTSAETLEVSAKFRSAIMAPVELYHVQAAKQSSQSLRAGGKQSNLYSVLKPGRSENLLRQLEVTDDGRVCAEFFGSVRSVIDGSYFLENEAWNHSELPFLVSLNPSVLKWHGERSPLKKMALYLFIELEKFQYTQGRSLTHFCNSLDSSQAKDFFAELLTKAGGLYDLGVLGWAEAVPVEPISYYREKGVLYGQGFCLQMIPFSEHLKSVSLFEKKLCESLSPCEVILKSALPPPPPFKEVVQESVREQLLLEPVKVESLENFNVVGSQQLKRTLRLRKFAKKSKRGFDLLHGGSHSAVARAKPLEKPRDHEKEYFIKLAQYYESLNASERRNLDFEMRSRSPHEFREWLRPILERLH